MTLEAGTPALPPLDAHVVLVQSGDGLSTAEVFAELRPEEWGSAANDLLAPALRLRPRLADVMALMTAAGGEPRLTGSGPTLFTMTDDAERAALPAPPQPRKDPHVEQQRHNVCGGSRHPHAPELRMDALERGQVVGAELHHL